LDWDDLRVFLAVARSGSLAGGARQLRTSQATAWRRVHALEEALGVKLFERRSTGYALTNAGANLLGALDGVQRTIEGVRRQVAAGEDASEGEVRLAVPDFVGLMVANAASALAAEHPRLVVELITDNPTRGLHVRDVDVAVRPERRQADGFTLEGVFSIPYGLYAAPAYLERHGHPRAIDDLDGHRLIAFDHAMTHIAPKPWMRAGGRGAAIVFRSNSPRARLLAARAGLGLVMLPEPMVRDTPGLQLVVPAENVGRLDVMLFVATELRREPRVAAVRDFVAGLLTPPA
jgi:molybdate transport repressor ModE-like protein